MPSLNPFRTITPVLPAEKLYTIAETNAMKISVKGTSERVDPLRRSRKKEAARIENLSKELRSRLFKIVEEFPQFEARQITGFYIETLDIAFSVDKIKQTLGSLSGAANVIWRIKREYLGKAWHAESVLGAKYVRRAAFGRMKSVIMKLDTRLKYLEEIRVKMRNMPGIDLNQPTFCIAGYPNVGKSSLVNAVTLATPEIGVYPFTTKEVTLGHFQIPVYVSNAIKKPITYISCQIVDTPGILDRSIDEMNEIEIRALTALRTLANAIVFLFDFTQNDALISQKNLVSQISSKFYTVPLLILCSKADLLDENQKKVITEYWEENFPQRVLYLVSMNDKDQIKSIIINFYEQNKTQIQQNMNKKKFGEV